MTRHDTHAGLGACIARLEATGWRIEEIHLRMRPAAMFTEDQRRHHV